MRDTSIWTGDRMTSARYITTLVRQRYPNFQWYSNSTYYSIPSLGETWGDSPGTYVEIRERNLSTRNRYGGFAVMGDSITLSGGNILRVTSLNAGNQKGALSYDLLYQEISSPSSLTSASTATLSSPARVWTGIGLAQHSTANVARLFYIRGSNNLMYYRDYTAGSGFGSTVQYTSSPTFNFDGVAIAPITHDEGFVITYDPASYKVTLHRFAAGSWTSAVMPMRYVQHPLNCHWFDAVALNETERLITFSVNGIQYATIYDANGFRDPWTVIAFTAEYGGAQTRICKLTTVGSRVVATAWSRFAGSSDDYEVSYYHLMWTDDGVNWAIPEEGYIGPTASRGKLHTKGNYAYILGASLAYVGDAVTWLGGTVGVKNISTEVVGHNIVQDLDQTSDMKLNLSLPSDFDHSLLEHGNEIVYQLGLAGESAIDIAKLILDTPGHGLDGYGQQVDLISRGGLKKLISFTSPMDQTIDSAQVYHLDFKEGGLYARTGIWSHDTSGVAWCERHEGADALATIGIQYKGQFQINTRVRVTKNITGCAMGIVFWYEGPQDYYRLDISPDAGGRAILRKIEANVTTTLANVDVTPGIVADTWYDLIVRYAGGTLYGYIRAIGSGDGWDEFLTFSAWDRSEPTAWYAGLFCAVPTTKATQSLDMGATHKIDVVSTTGFPTSGEVKIDNEIIAYPSVTATQFGSGESNSLTRAVRSTRSDHVEGAPVIVQGRRFEADFFTVLQDDRPMSVADACAYLVTMTGATFQRTTLVDDTASGVRVFPELHGHSYVFSGTYASSGFTLYFWTDTNNPPQSGFKVQVMTSSGGRAVLSDIVGGEIERQPVTIPSSGTFKVRVEKDTILMWVNGRFLCGFVVPGERTFRVGAVACNGNVTRLVADELFEAAEGLVWSMQESARDVLQRLLEGRDARLRERSDGSVQITLLEQRDNLGSLTGTYLVTYQRAAADDQWASAMVAWGAEEWVMVSVSGADRLRWVKWQTPHIYDRETLRKRATHRLRKLWALKDTRTFTGPYDPAMEVGDELTINTIRGIPSGRYMIRSIEIIGDSKQIDMNVTVQGLPENLISTTWPIKPGIDRPATGERFVWETPAGILKKLYDENAIDVYYDTPSDYSAGNGEYGFASYVVQEFNGSLFLGLSNVPMNGTGAIVCRLDTPGGTPVFEYNLSEEGVQNMCVKPDGSALFVTGVDVRNNAELCGIYKRDIEGTWTRMATLDASWQHVVSMTWSGSKLFVVGQGVPNVAYSEDEGVTWTYVTAPGDINRVYSVVDYDHNLIACGNSGINASLPYEIYRSTDYGDTWSLLYTSRSDEDSNQFHVWNNLNLNLIVGGVGINKLVTIDSDGVLTEFTTPFDLRKYYNTITIVGEYLCVLSTTGVWRTTDLVTWEKIWTLMPGIDTGSNSSLSMKSIGTWNGDIVVSSNGPSASLRGRLVA